MKKTLFIIQLLALAYIAVAQEVATDFTAESCGGESYNLFQDLDAGKVVVITWVMPCGPCVSPAVSAFSVTQNYDPNKVKFLLVDDYANTTCTQLQTWAQTYQMGNATTFSSSQISMTDYGVIGMPKVVVLGCNTHKVYDNQNNQLNSSSLAEAIDLALSECGNTSIDESNTKNLYQIYPNPSLSHIYISKDNKSSSSFSVYTLRGEKVIEMHNFEYDKPIDISFMPNGSYVIKFNDTSTPLFFIKTR